MILINLKISWIKGQHGYVQGVKGRKNYRHPEGSSFYNGFGGARMNDDMELTLTGMTESGKNVEIDIRGYVLEAIGRKKMSDSLFDKLEKCLPSQVEVDDDMRLTEPSLNEIIKSYNELSK